MASLVLPPLHHPMSCVGTSTHSFCVHLIIILLTPSVSVMLIQAVLRTPPFTHWSARP